MFNQFNLSAVAAAGGVVVLTKAFGKLFGGMKSIAQQSLGVYSNFESMQKGLETFYQSAEKGKSVFEKLRKYSNETTFGVDELSSAATQLLNVGVSDSSLISTLGMLGDVAGGSKQKFQELTEIYAKIQSTGKAGAEQLQQLALRGVPVYTVLKKIGVQGVATGNDITKAFQEMTKEGAQFYNAMNNVNDTIEGKEGFVSDYFRELMANFAEASGLADMYKQALEMVQVALGGVSDILKVINDNPFLKIVFQGTLSAAFIGLAAVVGGILVNAFRAWGAQLRKRIAELTAINALTGNWKNILAAGLVTGAAVGVAAALGKYVSDANKATEELKQALEEAKGTGGAGYNTEGGFTGQKYSAIEDYDNQQNLVAEYQNNYDNAKKILDEYNKKWEEYKKNHPVLMNSLVGSIEETIYNNQVQEMENTVRKYETVLKNGIDRLNSLASAAAADSEFKSAADILNDAVSKSDFSKVNAEIESYEQKLNELKKALEEIYPSSIAGVSQLKGYNESIRAINEIENKIRKLNGLAEKSTWREYWKQVTGADIGNNEILKMNGSQIGDATVKQLREQMNAEIAANKFVYGKDYNENNTKQNVLDNVNKMLSTLLSNRNLSDENFAATDKSIQALKDFADELEQVTEKFSLFDYANDLMSSGSKGGYVGGQLINTFGGVSHDLNNFAQGYEQTGSVFGAIISTVVGALYEVCQGLEGFEEAINPVTTLIRELSELIESIMSVTASVVRIIKSVAKILNTILKVIKPLTDLVNGLVDVIADAIENFSGGFSWIVSKIFTYIDEKEEEEEEKTADLTDAYKSLIAAMKENQELYEQRKRELNAKDYAANATGVHDMILTPHGNFSTDPDDYIIATKTPSALNGGGRGAGVIMLQPIIENNASDSVSVDVSQRTDGDGMANLIVTISRRIASDFAGGRNGWDSAIAAQKSSEYGRSLAM